MKKNLLILAERANLYINSRGGREKKFRVSGGVANFRIAFWGGSRFFSRRFSENHRPPPWKLIMTGPLVDIAGDLGYSHHENAGAFTPKQA